MTSSSTGGPQGSDWWRASDGNWYPADQWDLSLGAAPTTSASALGWWQADDSSWYPPEQWTGPADLAPRVLTPAVENQSVWNQSATPESASPGTSSDIETPPHFSPTVTSSPTQPIAESDFASAPAEKQSKLIKVWIAATGVALAFFVGCGTGAAMQDSTISQQTIRADKAESQVADLEKQVADPANKAKADQAAANRLEQERISKKEQAESDAATAAAKSAKNAEAAAAKAAKDSEAAAAKQAKAAKDAEKKAAKDAKDSEANQAKDAKDQIFAGRPDAQKKDQEELVGGAAKIDGLSATVTSVEFVQELSQFETDGYFRANITIVNEGDDSKPYSQFDWRFQTANGQVLDATFSTEPSLGSGDLVSGGTVTGTVIFPAQTPTGYVIWKPNPFKSDRGIWPAS
ncbi:MAG: DUF4352 domain-containing protein [Actinobacteria bacterium]|uniref:Unannotated protein n=1 Tax=freshwater metagenome TaxID=449393 RepID=A0A6J6XWE4_9ZZZZ|nr:DUF4352 domain-containing protein [Actinomycetota bacterium]